MANVFTFYFKASDIDSLMKLTPDYFLVSVDINEVGVIGVSANACKKGVKVLGSKPGCPVPPCVPTIAAIASEDCIMQTEQLLQSIKDNS